MATAPNERPNDPNQEPDIQNTDDAYYDWVLRILRILLVIMLLWTFVNIALLISSRVQARYWGALDRINSISSISTDISILKPANWGLPESLRPNLDEPTATINYTDLNKWNESIEWRHVYE